MTPRTLNDIFFAIVSRNQPKVVLFRQPSGWVPLSAQEYSRSVMGVSRALQNWNIGRGDRVAILSENRPEWTIADLACLMLGAVTVPIYSTLTDVQTAYLLRDSGCRAIFVSSEQQLEKVLAIRDQTSVEQIVVMDTVETAHAHHMYRLMATGPEGTEGAIMNLARSVGPDDLATIIYTSGTTGTPKGAMLTHGNMASNISCSLLDFGVHDGEISISFLPLSHVTARHVDLGMMFRGVTLAYVGAVEHLPKALLEVRPEIFVGVPRVYQKVHTKVDLEAKGFPKEQIYRWALRTGRAHQAETLAGIVPSATSWKVANKLVFSKVRAGMGGNVKLFISGGAPLGRELADWYADIGIRIHEGYGLTETSPVIAVNTPGAHKIGTVGKPLPNIEVRIADDGEVLVRGPSVFTGYWNRPEETREAFVDGWFKTGDIGVIDEDGFLAITDRKKDLIKTSGGKFIAPQPIENSLKHNALVAEAVVLGEKQKFPAVLICPYFPLLEDWARANHVPFSSREQLVEDARVRALYEGIVQDLNQTLARFEKLKKVLLVPDEFSVESGTLTASMKLRRRAVTDRYRREIEEMYEKAEGTAVPST